MKRYKLYGLNILSDLELESEVDYFDETDLTVQYGKVPELINAKQLTEYTSSNGIDTLVSIPDLAKYYIVDKDKVIIEALCENTLAIRLFFIGRVIDVILVKNNIIPFHGSALSYKGNGFVITGRSGAGKTSLTTGLIEQGFSILADDLVGFRLQDQIQILPGFANQKVDFNLIKLFELDDKVDQLITYPWDEEDEFYISRSSDKLNEAVKAKYVILLIPSNENKITEFKGMDKVHLLLSNIYGGYLTKYFSKNDGMFTQYSELAKQVRLFVLNRMHNELCIDEQIKLIMKVVEYDK